MPRDYRKLHVFDAADALVLAVYQGTRAFPREELFGLTSQIRRSAASVAANIVEGASRHSEAEFLQFLNVAYGSLAETGYYIELSFRLGYLSRTNRDHLSTLHDQTSRKLNRLMQTIRGSVR